MDNQRYKVIYTQSGLLVPGADDLCWLDAVVVQGQHERRCVKTSIAFDDAATAPNVRPPLRSRS